jgi:hypothetical protein
VNSNKLIWLIIGILIGSLATAAEKVPASAHADSFLAAVHVAPDHANKYIEVNATFKSKIPEKQARKIRPRFRGVSFFTLQQINSSTQSSFTFYDQTVPLPTGNQAPALPFYYIFLFRLTPF